MKVLIIAPNSLRYCPYTFFYIDILKKRNIKFDIVYADRHKLNEAYDFQAISFKWDSSKSKINQFWNYRKFLNHIIFEKKYDKVIALTTIIAVLINDILIRKFKNNYIVDVRDFTYENNFLYRIFEKRVIQNSNTTLISSSRFTDFLPKFPYISVYNVPQNFNFEKIKKKETKRNNIIKISYVGSIAYKTQCEKLLYLVERDDRFRFELHGNDMSGDYFQNLIKNKNIKNTKYFGPYTPIEKSMIIEESDILFNAYGNQSQLLRCALSNKLADAAIYKKVVLNSPNTFMHEKLGICSYAIDLNNVHDLNGLYEWYINLDEEKINEHLNCLIDDIKNTNLNAIKYISEWLSIK